MRLASLRGVGAAGAGVGRDGELVVVRSDNLTCAPAASVAPTLQAALDDWDRAEPRLRQLAAGFGFFCSKPATAFSPLAVTPDELGSAWRDGRAHVRVRTTYNGQLVGDTDAGPEMHFSFFDLIAHVTRTRALTAGTILGS